MYYIYMCIYIYRFHEYPIQLLWLQLEPPSCRPAAPLVAGRPTRTPKAEGVRKGRVV